MNIMYAVYDFITLYEISFKINLLENLKNVLLINHKIR